MNSPQRRAGLGKGNKENNRDQLLDQDAATDPVSDEEQHVQHRLHYNFWTPPTSQWGGSYERIFWLAQLEHIS